MLRPGRATHTSRKLGEQRVARWRKLCDSETRATTTTLLGIIAMDAHLGVLVRESAADVHAELGGGLSECIYQAALALALRQRGCLVEAEVVIPVTYQNTYVGFLRPDLVVNKRLVVEIKAVQKVAESHIAQTRAYMRWLPPPPPPPFKHGAYEDRLAADSEGRQSLELGAVINFGPERVEVVSVAFNPLD